MSALHPSIPACTIAERTIGGGAPAFVVAEIGVNHDGDVRKALELIDVAVEGGADAVKFQVFRAAELASAQARTAGYQRKAAGRSQREMLAKLELSDDDLCLVRAHCDTRKVMFLATPFSVPDVRRLVGLDVAAFKTSSADLNHFPLLAAIARVGRPMIVSTGASTACEIADAVAALRGWNATDRLVLLHCVSRYPTPIGDANLRTIGVMRTMFDLPIGYSDHTLSTYVGGWAVSAGACVLEKHITLDHQDVGPDHEMSLDPAEFAAYVAIVRETEQALGQARIGMTAREAEVRRVARKSIVAVEALRAGESLTAEKLTFKRPGTGIAPNELDRLLGRRLTRDIPPDAVITWDMVR